jgi:hypothetical protein
LRGRKNGLVPNPAGPGDAPASSHGDLTIPVVVEARKETVLHLEGGGGWPNKHDFNATNPVHLPAGRIIGWKARANL